MSHFKTRLLLAFSLGSFTTGCQATKPMTALQKYERTILLSEAERLQLPESDFVTPTKVKLGDDYYISTDKLARIDGVLTIISTRKTAEGVKTQANTHGDYWHNRVPIRFRNTVSRRTRELFETACREFGVRCTCSNGDGDRVEVIIKSGSGRSNASEFGQDNPVNIELYGDDAYSYSTVAHELGHALGLTHEQQRRDRDNYVRVDGDDDGNNKIMGQQVGGFDFESIMLYPNGSGVHLLEPYADRANVNGYTSGRVSRADADATLATKGPTDLGACLDSAYDDFTEGNYNFTSTYDINNSTAPIAQNSGNAYVNVYVTNTGAKRWDNSAYRFEISEGQELIVSDKSLPLYMQPGERGHVGFWLRTDVSPGTYRIRGTMRWNGRDFYAPNAEMYVVIAEPAAPVSVPSVPVQGSNQTFAVMFIGDATTSQPIVGASVELTQNSTSPRLALEASNVAGYVGFNFEPGSYFIRRSATGYQDDSFTIRIPEDVRDGLIITPPLRATGTTPAITTTPAPTTSTLPTTIAPPAKMDQGIVGHIDGLIDYNGGKAIYGWACAKNTQQSINVHLYARSSTGEMIGLNGGAIADAASESAISSLCQTTGISHRFVIPVSQHIAQYSGYALVVFGISPVGLDNLPLNRSGEILMPTNDRGIIGYIDGIVDFNGGKAVQGWACAKNTPQSINVHLYARKPTGEMIGLDGGAMANVAAESAISSLCGTTSTAHRFMIPISQHLPQVSGNSVVVFGISPVGLDNLPLNRSGEVNFP